MEKILEEINNEIKKIAQSEEIDTQKLTELINSRDRLKAYNTTSVSQISGFNNPITPTFPALGNRATGNGMFDGIMDLFEMYSKSQMEQLKIKNNVSIHDLIYYHRFISESINYHETDNEIFEIKGGIEQLIMKELKNLINKENNKEKDKILEATIEIKNVEKSTQPLEVQHE